MTAAARHHAKFFGLLAATILVLFTTPALAGGAVRYEMGQLNVGDSKKEYVLMPVNEASLTGPDNTGKLIKAFNLIKAKSRKLYLGSSVRINRGTPQVIIDKAAARYSWLIIAESVYTLTEFGAKGVEFPGYAQGLVTRPDVPFSVYTLTVPLWRAVQLKDLTSARVLLADGSMLSSSEFQRRWKKKDKALVNQLYAYLKSPNSTTVFNVQKLLPTLRVSYVDQILPTLSHEFSYVRQGALEVLDSKRDDRKVLAAVSKQLAREEDVGQARLQAAFLGKAKGDRYAVLEQFFLLEDGTDKERKQAIEALAKYEKDKRALERLSLMLTGTIERELGKARGDKKKQVVLSKAEQQAVAEAAMGVLAKIDADAQQLAALKNSKIDAALRMKIAEDLVADKTEASKIGGLTYIMDNADESTAVRAIAQLGAINSDRSRRKLESYVGSAVGYVRAAVAEQLRALGNPESLDAITKAMAKYSDDRALEDAGYAIMSSQPDQFVMDKTLRGSSNSKRLAYLALGAKVERGKASRVVINTLKQGADSRDANIRGAVARSLTANPKNTALNKFVINKLSKDKSEGVRVDIARAFKASTDPSTVAVLDDYVGDKSADVACAAMDALGARSEAIAYEKIEKLTESKNDQLKGCAYVAIARLLDKSDATAVGKFLDKLSGSANAASDFVRASSATALGYFPGEQAVFALANLVNDKDASVRIAAAQALGRTKSSDAADILARMLQDDEPKVRMQVVGAIAELGKFGRPAKGKLAEQLKEEKNVDVQDALKSALKKL